MFTGIVEEIGRVGRVERRSGLQRTLIHARRVLSDLSRGDSVNVSGACQTVVETAEDGFVVESVPETLRRTTLGRLNPGDPANLERALRADSRFGGHIVLGHVDGVGRIEALVQRTESWELDVEAPRELARYIAPKGSIAIDGVSLTVVDVSDSRFTVAVIPHTFHNTTLAALRPSDRVNLEVDVLARYLERFLDSKPPRGLTWEGLRTLGY